MSQYAQYPLDAVEIVVLPLPPGAATLAEQQIQSATLQQIEDNTDGVETTLSSIDTKVSTASKQDVGNASLASIDAKLTNPLPVSGPLTDAQLRASPVPVSGTVAVSNFPATQPVSGTVTANIGTTGGLALDATLTAGSQKSQLVDGSGNVWGPRTGVGFVNYMPIINLEAASDGAAVAARSLQIGGSDGTNLRNISTDTTGKINLNDISGTVSLPTGAATATNQTDGSQQTQIVDASGVPAGPMVTVGPFNFLPIYSISNGTEGGPSSGPLQVVGGQDSGNILRILSLTSDGFVNTNLPLDASTATNQATIITSLSNIDAGVPAALGQTTMANSMPVVIASNQSAIPISGTVTTGGLTDAQLRASPVPVSGTVAVSNFPATQAISAAALPLPTGAATSALQTTGNASLASIDAGTPAALGQTTMAASMPVTIASDQARQDLAPASPSAASVGVASAQAVASNASRKGLTLVNTSAARISIGLGAAAVLNSGITLFPGGSWEMDAFNFDTGAINAIASAAASNLAIQEFS